MDAASDWERYLAKPGHRHTDPDEAAYAGRREEAYRELFGSAPYVFTLPIPTPPGALDVLLFDEPAPHDLPLVMAPGSLHEKAPGQSQRGFTTLVTSGMSDRRMAYPEGTPRRFLRVELAMYLSQDAVRANPDLPHFCSDVLMHYAKQPFLDDTFLLPGMILPIMTLNQGRVTFFGDPGISALIVAPPPDHLPESEILSKLELGGDAVNLFCLLPLTLAQERIARFDLDAHGAVRSFEMFAVLASLEPVYRGPPKDDPSRGPVGKLHKETETDTDTAPKPKPKPKKRPHAPPKAKAKSKARAPTERANTAPPNPSFWKRPISDFWRGVLLLITGGIGLVVDALAKHEESWFAWPAMDRPFRWFFWAALVYGVLLLLREGLRVVDGTKRGPD